MPPRENDTQKVYPNKRAIVQENAVFAFNLYQREKNIEGNLLFSPFGISTALAVLHAGARGETAIQIAKTIRFTLGKEMLAGVFSALNNHLQEVHAKGKIRLRMANSLWNQKGRTFINEFMIMAGKHYGTVIESVDFSNPEAACLKINAWVAEKTENTIKNIIDSSELNADILCILTDAIYFEGNWVHPFEKTRTEDAAFWLGRSERVLVPMMTQTEKLNQTETDRVHILELPYLGDDLSMVILLPKRIDGLAELEDMLSVVKLEEWMHSLHREEIIVFLPKFKLNCRFMLNDALRSMGLIDAFDGNKADFSAMVTGAWCIEKMIHKTYIDVNEEGTEASAVTLFMGPECSERPALPPTFRADHPFIFLIREKREGIILFLGRVVNPLSDLQ